MSTRILVTGAQGFVGRYLIAHLLRTWRDIEVLGLGRSPRLETGFTHFIQWGNSRLRAPLPEDLRAAADSSRYHYVSLDLGRQPELTGQLGEFRPHFIFHMASGLRDAPADHLFRTNVEGTIYLME